MTQQKKFSTYDLVIVGVMAALVFAATFFLKIGPIPTPVGPTQIKLANALCLLAGMLFPALLILCVLYLKSRRARRAMAGE